MIDKEERIKELRDKISYWTEQLKVVNSQVDKGIISDKILNAKRELGFLESKSLDRIRKVDIIDAPPLADRLETKKSRSGSSFTRNKITFTESKI